MILASLAAGLLLGLACRPGNTGPAPVPSEVPARTTPDRLAAPPMPANPTQADYGARVYWLQCMACHGDRGQGLTVEWRAAVGAEDQNCWQSKCHAANHPPEGFELPASVPPVIGDGALARFATATDLQRFIRARMPWQAPGSLDESTAWQLTAYLVRANGIATDEQLKPQNAPTIRLRPAVEPPATAFDWRLAASGIAALLALVGLVVGRRVAR